MDYLSELIQEFKPKLALKLSATLLALLLLAGCASTDTALQNINKDWNKTIRAAHVYPVNPLTQDLQPGDIFFTDRTIEDLSAWDATGYLPLDHLIARLYPSNYPAFYQYSFGIGKDEFLPQLWVSDNSWSNAPVAAFPGYTFKISQGGAMNVSLPIQGVPVGLGLMGAKNASGTVTITDAHTYGIDEMSLLEEVENFVNVPTNAAKILKQFPPGDAATNGCFLQVVSRVYSTGKVAVSMVNESAAGGSLSVGAGAGTSVPPLQGADAALDYSNLLTAVNSIVNSAAGGLTPGGAIKFTQVSSRSVSLDETFPKPVLIGYVGFSVPVSQEQLERIAAQKGPRLVPPEQRIQLHRTSLDPRARDKQTTTFGQDLNTPKLRAWLKADSANRQKMRDWLDQHGLQKVGITNVLDAKKYAHVRQQLVDDFSIY